MQGCELEDNGFRRIWRRYTHPITQVVCISIALIAAVSGPFGTIDTMSFFNRLVYWTAIAFGTTAAAYLVREVTAGWVRKDRPILFEATATILMVLVCTPFVAALTDFLDSEGCSEAGCFAELALYTALTTVIVFVVRRVIPGFEELVFFARDEHGNLQLVAPSPVPPKQVEAIPRPRLYQRLPKGETGTVLHLTASGHFVTVTLSTGEYKIRMRFTDAVNEMDMIEGYCTHRSHWVARAAVAGHGRVDGKPVLILENGMEVPVSRTYRPELETAGLIPHQA